MGYIIIIQCHPQFSFLSPIFAFLLAKIRFGKGSFFTFVTSNVRFYIIRFSCLISRFIKVALY
ncbi:hypothetical protein BDA99DRAFT_520308 [Phascolomyces articulosus]|uniref:Uncharacterized protein n=1 Tax=Phascolomyces articulosus TaxID=60185 RepID=A0AAD5PA66_9FUNG|nr:hypothetical protein BDA99DRAFT_520308 [Phascolomyces articulosus]